MSIRHAMLHGYRDVLGTMVEGAIKHSIKWYKVHCIWYKEYKTPYVMGIELSLVPWLKEQ